MEDINQLAQQLIAALRSSTEANISFQGMQRRNFFEETQNRAASRGTLYSTGPRAQQLKYEGDTYLPAVTQARQQQLQKEITIGSDLLETKRKIDALNRSAQELNGITFDHLLQ